MKKTVLYLLAFCFLLFLSNTAFAEKYIDGTYEASSEGFGGEIIVKLTIKNGDISDVVITGEQETPTVGGAVIPYLTEDFMNKKTSDIDGFSGATFTSNGVKDALAKALELASGHIEITPEPTAEPASTPSPYMFTVKKPDGIEEGFTIHNGVQFGMTKEDVQQLESAANFSSSTWDLDLLDTCRHWNNFLSFSGTVAGQDGASILYHFNDNNLDSAIYFLALSTKAGGTSSTFALINDALASKYGDGDEAALTAIQNGELDFCVNHFYEKERLSSSNQIGYILKQPFTNAYSCVLEDGNVIVIYICSEYAEHSMFGDYFGEMLFVEYQLFDSETYNKATHMYTNESISNDL